ncbi:MAG TPA: hypothetical protein VFL28_01125 [bacterium]|nr:hypothetical protein [bacterium]
MPRSLAYPAQPAWWILGRNLPRHAERVAIRLVDPETARDPIAPPPPGAGEPGGGRRAARAKFCIRPQATLA